LNNVAIALGSNVGDRQAHLEFAVAALRDVVGQLLVSPWYDTVPVGVGAQANFLNGAIAGETALPARALLDTLLRVERERGRARPFAGAPRTLDLDLILYGSAIIDEPGMQVPHPRFRDRLFVLDPLADIAPDWIDPVSGRTIADLRARLHAK
jgi:2-amino-4-hydroxy-6-hydroxymethyldihydropteridine diphosphokinase